MNTPGMVTNWRKPDWGIDIELNSRGLFSLSSALHSLPIGDTE